MSNNMQRPAIKLPIDSEGGIHLSWGVVLSILGILFGGGVILPNGVHFLQGPPQVTVNEITEDAVRAAIKQELEPVIERGHSLEVSLDAAVKAQEAHNIHEGHPGTDYQIKVLKESFEDLGGEVTTLGNGVARIEGKMDILTERVTN